MLRVVIALLAAAVLVTGCGYAPSRPVGSAEVGLDVPAPSDSPSATSLPSPSPSPTPTSTPTPTATPAAVPTPTPTAAPTPTATPPPPGYLFTWSGSGPGTSPRIVWTNPGGYWADLNFNCSSGAASSFQMVEWTMATGSPDGWGVGPLHRASFSGSPQSTYSPQYTGPQYARWLHIEATADCSWSVVVRQNT